MDKDGIKEVCISCTEYANKISEARVSANPPVYSNSRDNSGATQLTVSSIAGKYGTVKVKSYVDPRYNVKMDHIQGFVGQDYFVDMCRTYSADLSGSGMEEKICYAGAFTKNCSSTDYIIQIKATHETGADESKHFEIADSVFNDALKGVYSSAKEAGVNPAEMGMPREELVQDLFSDNADGMDL